MSKSKRNSHHTKNSTPEGANRAKSARLGGRDSLRQKNEMGEARIIGGDFRGRKLPVRQAEGLRPTSDRIRETLFNWLQFEVPGASCLDVFSGSGALGFEALSRGAASVVCLELSAQNANQLKANQQLLKAANISVIQTDSLAWLENHAEKPFDIIFIDPPFHQGLMQPTLDKLFGNGYIGDSTWLYLEQEKPLDWPLLPEEWVCYREKTTSQVRLGLWCIEH
ncbi:16S rRNA (guanine(966)-N(2))-methyltransferase RsmD [Hydrogenovibrio sp. JE_KL2]|uniref:16S rRNA (guanine(966)-N(2))-methyltransferase RsmD n=1 Tax=Hydrogenovibrio sp. JE_KL2 TaxID=2651188 RepID=UPI0020A57959|nr:16S rRNA (guanine(966)-N(2))-methyltransferase RsmD [Hydrogenovibrio sp. JE_KL2]